MSDDDDEKKIDEMERAGILTLERANVERIRKRWGFVGTRPISEATLGNHHVSAERLFSAAGQGALQANAMAQRANGLSAERMAYYEGMAVMAAGVGIEPADAAKWEQRYAAEQARANKLSDEAGSLRTERDELLRENATLRRKLERATQTGSKP